MDAVNPAIAHEFAFGPPGSISGKFIVAFSCFASMRSAADMIFTGFKPSSETIN